MRRLNCNRLLCPEILANKILGPYGRHHEVSRNLNPHLNASNFVKNEIIWKLQIIVFDIKYSR